MALAVLLLGASACTNDSPKSESASGQSGSVAGAVDEQPEDVEDDKLKEPVKKRKIDVLQEEAARTLSVCDVWRELDNINPPDQRNRAETIKHAEQMYTILKLFDPKRPVLEKVDVGSGRGESVQKILPPPDLLSDIELLRKGWYAQWIRLSTYHEWYKAGTIDDPGLRRRTSKAFLILTGDELTKAQRRLAGFEVTHCHL